MPITTTAGREKLETDIREAFARAKSDGSNTGANPEIIISNLAEDISNAIDDYVIACVVTIPPGTPTLTKVTLPTGIVPFTGNVVGTSSS